MFRQGAETVEAVLLSVERASPKGLALFLLLQPLAQNVRPIPTPTPPKVYYRMVGAHFAGPHRPRTHKARAPPIPPTRPESALPLSRTGATA